MVVHKLPIVVLSTWYNVANVAAFHGIVAILVHQGIGLLQVTLVVPCRRRCLMMHEQLHPLAVGIVVECLNVEVWIRSNKVEDVEFAMPEPVFPAFIPSFY